MNLKKWQKFRILLVKRVKRTRNGTDKKFAGSI